MRNKILVTITTMFLLTAAVKGVLKAGAATGKAAWKVVKVVAR